MTNNLTTASKACDDYVFGGYSDWYLPSYVELRSFSDYSFQNPNSTAYLLGVDLYWTSTAIPTSNKAFILQGTNSSTSVFSWTFDEYWAVRAMRSF